MIFLHRVLTQDSQQTASRIWACCTYANAMFCSKHILAEALFENASLPDHPEIKEVVCASRGNLSTSVAMIALRHGVDATIFLPNYASDRNVSILRLLGATVFRLEMNDLTEQIAPAAREYANEDPSRLFLDQFDLAWCSEVYTQRVFSALHSLFPLEGQRRPVRLIVPCGTGSLLIASARFLNDLQGDEHQLVPVFLQDPSPKKQAFLSDCQSQYPRVQILKSEISTPRMTSDTLRTFAPMFEIPFGLTSADCMAVAIGHQQREPTKEIDIVPILTDSFQSIEIHFDDLSKS